MKLCSYILKQGTSWNYKERAGTTWKHLERDGLSKELIQKNKKFQEEIISAIPLLSRMQILAIVIITKSTKYLQVKPCVTEWNQ